MKKRIIIALVIGFVSISAMAKAGNTSEILTVPSGNNDGGNKTVKSQSKYTFTLFSFFTTENKTAKSDTSKSVIRSSAIKEKGD